MMRALYDSKADALAIELAPDAVARWSDEISERTIVDLGADDAAVGVQLLYLRGEEEQTLAELGEVAERYGLDREALEAAALAAPDRDVTVDVGARVAA